VGRVFPSTHPLGWGECPHEPILIALPRIRFSPSCGHPSAPTGRPTTARGTAPGNPPQKENQPQALKGRTSLSARSLSTSSPETPFQGSFLLWAANPGRCPGLSSPAQLGLASDRVRPLRIASDKSAPSRPEPVPRWLDGVSPHPRKTSTSVGRVSPRADPGPLPYSYSARRAVLVLAPCTYDKARVRVGVRVPPTRAGAAMARRSLAPPLKTSTSVGRGSPRADPGPLPYSYSYSARRAVLGLEPRSPPRTPNHRFEYE
jgi:hypothetical protein